MANRVVDRSDVQFWKTDVLSTTTLKINCFVFLFSEKN